jgi:predicted HTH domain antitoxin
MVLNISDDLMRAAGLTEEEARFGFAYWLYDTRRLSMGKAAEMCGMTRDEFWGALIERGWPAFRVTEEDFNADMETLKRLGI